MGQPLEALCQGLRLGFDGKGVGVDDRNNVTRTAAAAAPVPFKEIPDEVEHAGKDEAGEQKKAHLC